MLRFENVSYRYEKEAPEAVKGVSFRVEAGSFTAILGHNGSGKSTLAKLINALFLPEEGEIWVDGLKVSEENAWEVRKICGMVFQNPDNQLVASIVEEDVAFGLENLGKPPADIRARVAEALQSVGMAEFARSAPHLLSGGQKQRVAIAGVLAMRPKMIVFDESTAMLDPRGREEVMGVVKMLNREHGITVLWITHFMDEAAEAQRILVMDDGEIALDGAPRDVFARADEMRALGLDVPEMADLSLRLRAAGLPLPEGILTVAEMEEALCRLR